MTIGFMQVFPWGERTYFEEKIKLGCFHEPGTLIRLELAGGVYDAGFIDVYPKIHTFREDPLDRWKAGNKIHAVYGNQTKNRREFIQFECTGTQKLEIRYAEKFVTFLIDNRIYAHYPIALTNYHYADIELINTLARNDGFRDAKHLLQWFKSDFKGKIIHWTSKHY